MKGRIIFLLEEPSMKHLLEGLLPRMFPGWEPGLHFLCVPHEGKSNLDRSIPIKLKAWREPDVRFVVVRDNDGADCVDIKARLLSVCADAGRPETLVRLVCQELESWYIGDLHALADAFRTPKLSTPALHKRFADPDGWLKPSVELKRLLPAFQKISGARAMAAYLDDTRNVSPSFHFFVAGVRGLATEMGYSLPQN